MKISEFLIKKIVSKYKCDLEGSCDYVIEDIAKELIKETKNFKVIEGWVMTRNHPVAHTWIEINGEIIDPTKIQFKDKIKYRKDDFSFYWEDSGTKTKHKTKVFNGKEYLKYAEKEKPSTPRKFFLNKEKIKYFYHATPRKNLKSWIKYRKKMDLFNK